MRILLDTHTYLWLRLEPRRLSQTAAAIIEDSSNELLLSLVSLWEMTIKAAKDQLKLPASNISAVRDELQEFGIELLGLDATDISVLESLPLFHGDPFDRLLIAQTFRHRLTLLSDDGAFIKYKVPTLWK